MAMAGAAPMGRARQTVLFAGDRRADTMAVVFIWAAFSLATAIGSYGAAIDLMSTDDAMRLVEVRDFLAGQGWFDLVQRRLDPPDGVLMHWSRLIDLPIALLLAGFGALFSPETALKLTLTVWPALPMLPALLAAASVSRSLAGPGAAVVGALLFALSPGLTGRFTPAMIDHHGPQVALALVMLACALRLDRSTKAAIGAGLAAAAMLAIGMETLPVVASIAALIALRWAMEGAPMARGAAVFGLAFALGALAVFVATIPPWRWSAPVCDALGVGDLVAAVVGGAGLALATRARGEGGLARLAALGLVGAAAVIGVALVAPGCLADPYAGLPETLKTEWLARVREARDVATFVSDEPAAALVIIASALAGVVAAFWSVATAPLALRWRVWTGAGALAVACIVATWQVRGVTFVCAFGVPFLASAMVAIARSGEDRVRGLIAIIALNPTACAYLAIGAGIAVGLPQAANDDAPLGCRTADYAALSALPAGLALNTVDTGPYILAFSKLSVVAAPYHRDVDGLMAQLDAFTDSEETARAVAVSRKAAYVIVCPADAGVSGYARRFPESFSAGLVSGRTPSWLTRVDLGPGATLAVYKVTP